MPNPEAHKGVHALQDQERKYLIKQVDAIVVQQEIATESTERTERNIWKIAEKLGVATE